MNYELPTTNSLRAHLRKYLKKSTQKAHLFTHFYSKSAHFYSFLTTFCAFLRVFACFFLAWFAQTPQVNLPTPVFRPKIPQKSFYPIFLCRLKNSHSIFTFLLRFIKRLVGTACYILGTDIRIILAKAHANGQCYFLFFPRYRRI